MRVLITGSNRGLGLEFTKQFLERGEEVIATCRSPEEAINLHKLKARFEESLMIHKLNVSSQESINNSFIEIKNNFNYLDLLINNSGIVSGSFKNDNPFGTLYTEDIIKVFRINAIAPVLIVEKFFSLLKNGRNPKIANISSIMGSISLKTQTNRYSYDASKAALNMFSKALAHRLKSDNITLIILHPGWVKTDMGTASAPLTPKISVEGMIKIIDESTLSNTGEFIDWEGNPVPW